MFVSLSCCECFCGIDVMEYYLSCQALNTPGEFMKHYGPSTQVVLDSGKNPPYSVAIIHDSLHSAELIWPLPIRLFP